MNDNPYGLNFSNVSFFIGTTSGNQVLVLQNEIIIRNFTITQIIKNPQGS